MKNFVLSVCVMLNRVKHLSVAKVYGRSFTYVQDDRTVKFFI